MPRFMLLAILAVCVLGFGILSVRAQGPDGPLVCHVTRTEPGPLPGTEFRFGRVIPAPSEKALEVHLGHGDQEVGTIGAHPGDECSFLAETGD